MSLVIGFASTNHQGLAFLITSTLYVLLIICRCLFCFLFDGQTRIGLQYLTSSSKQRATHASKSYQAGIWKSTSTILLLGQANLRLGAGLVFLALVSCYPYEQALYILVQKELRITREAARNKLMRTHSSNSFESNTTHQTSR